MKSLKSLLLCLCLISSSFGFAASEPQRDKNTPVIETEFQNGFPNIFRPIGKFFGRLFGKKSKGIREYPFPSIESLNLSRTDIVAECLANSSCSTEKPTVEVSAEGRDSLREEIFYRYEISGGQIIGTGSKVTWDLSKANPGIYTITAIAEDACGGCGKRITKEVKVIECPDCR